MIKVCFAMTPLVRRRSMRRRGGLDFHASFVNEILQFIQENRSDTNPRVSIKLISDGLGIPRQDVRVICTIIRRMHYINTKIMQDTHEYWLTAAGIAHLGEIENLKRHAS